MLPRKPIELQDIVQTVERKNDTKRAAKLPLDHHHAWLVKKKARTQDANSKLNWHVVTLGFRR
ncbi:MAG: hypothetical protein U1F27_14920 [Turneriella sp.]